MKKEDAEEFTQSLGQIVGGSYRQIMLAQRLGVPRALGMKTKQWVNDRLGGYVRMSGEDRLKAVLELKAEGESNRSIADAIGVDHQTINNDVSGENSPEDGAFSEVGIPCHGENSPRRTPPPPAGQFSLILADPPWRYEHSISDSRRIENQYPTMDLDDICALGVPAADDSILFLWATSPKLTEAMRVIDAWGFTYRTCAVWDKEIIGMGYYFRQQHELLLVAARGEFPPPAEDARVPSVIHGRRSKHSEKPDAVYRILEAAYPELTEKERLEMFARQRRQGWHSWGNEVLIAA